MIKYIKFFLCVLEHKFYVFVKCIEYAFKYKLPILIVRGILHDYDKLIYPSIFIPYAKATFSKGRNINYGLKDGMPNEKLMNFFTCEDGHFRRAIIEHRYTNKHHWEFWRGHEIPKVYVLEIIADFLAANKIHKDFPNSLAWYNKNKYKIILHRKTTRLVGYLLKKECK